MLEPERPLSRGVIRHWELLGLLAAAALAAWQTVGGIPVAVVAVVAGVAIPFRPPGRRVLPLAIAALAIAGGVLGTVTTSQVRAIENAWGTDTSGVRGRLIERASGRLAADLTAAVSAARALADLAIARSEHDRLVGGRVLRAAADRGGLERSVTLFAAGEPWIWAGRHRVIAVPEGPELSARITPFYVVLEARRQRGDRTAVAQVTLAADSAVPQRAGVLAQRFAAGTGVGLRFYPPGRGPLDADVFDYCIPACGDAAAAPDTLFGVRMEPPSQGTHKLGVEGAGRRRVALAGLALLVLVLAGGRPLGQGLAGAALVGWLVFAPASERLWAGGPFSAATFFTGVLGPFSASAGALAATAALTLVAAVVVAGRGGRAHPARFLVAALLVLGVTWLMPVLATGITPPTAGTGVGLWLQWQVSLTLVAAALLVGVSLLLGWGSVRAPGWITGLALGGTAALITLSLLSWTPDGWGAWHALAWLPVFMLAAQPASRVRMTVAVGLAAGGFAAVLTWGAVAQGRLGQAARDVAALRRGGDPIAVGLLERFGQQLAREPAPRTAGVLYSHWTRSPLAGDGYPAILSVWSGRADPEARLRLADLTIPPDSEYAAVRRARDSGDVVTTSVAGVPATRYVLAVPWEDGTVATVALGPRSRVIAPRRIARFLRGDPVRPAPYTIVLSDPVGDASVPSAALAWRRDGSQVRGEHLLEFPEGARHVHVTVPLGDMPAVPVRGALILMLDLALLALLVLAGEAIARRARLPGSVTGFAARSFRARLAGALVVFFVVPTVAFTLWSVRRLDAEAQRSRDLIIRQTLQDASGTAHGFLPVPEMPEILARELLDDLGERLSADFMLFDRGRLVRTTPSVLGELGVVDPYLPEPVLEQMLGEDNIEVQIDQVIAGRATRVGYRALEGPIGLGGVLAAPRLAEDSELVQSEQDLMYGLVLITLAGLLAALGFATIAARSLARPVRELRDAALQVGRGGAPAPLGDVPFEFRPVADAFERMARDVDRSRTALEAQRARTAAVLRSVATGIIALDDSLHVIAANQRAEELVGPVPPGKSLGGLGDSEWAPVWRWLASQAAFREPPDPAEFSVGDREIRVQLAPLSGPASGWVVAFDDTTERTRAVRVLAWGELARQIAHEIKNPLTPIRLGVQHLRRAWQSPRGDFDETLERTTGQILAEIERLDAVARAFSRFGAPHEAAGALETIDIVQAAREVAGLYALGETPELSVEPEGPVHALARRDEFKEVLVNLVDNARNAGASRVRIVARRNGDRVHLHVRDDGRGIAPADLPRIFEPRFSTTTSGAGLGLAISRRLVSSWGGTIIAASAPGRETTLTLELLA